MKNNKVLLWVLGALAVVLIVVAVVYVRKNDTDMTGEDVVRNDTVGGEVVPTEDVSEGSVTTPVAGSGSVTLSYQQALTKYASARMQFDAQCATTPKQATWKNGTLIMLDNRSALPRTIRLGGMGNVSIKAWGFKIVKLSASNLPQTLLVDCGVQQNVASILVQK